MAYFAAKDKGSASASGVPALYNHVLKDLSSAHFKYLEYWDRLIGWYCSVFCGCSLQMMIFFF